MIAQHIGAEIFATAKNKVKREILASQYRIPDTHIFFEPCLEFQEGHHEDDCPQGVDVVLSSASGQALLDIWECIASFGTFVEIGKTDIYRNSNLNMQPFDKIVVEIQPPHIPATCISSHLIYYCI